METRRGLFTKLGIFGSIALGLFVVGKYHIASYKDKRHRNETDARIDSEENEFGILAKRPGFPQNNPTLNYESDQRNSRYEGTGSSYSTRRSGDRFNMSAIFSSKWQDDEKKK